VVASATAVLLAACAAPPGADPAWGESKQAAIEVCRPAGERAYLARLACASGEPATFTRVGSVGLRESLPPGTTDDELRRLAGKMSGVQRLAAGDPHVHIVDQYRAVCQGTERMLYLDMYHCDAPPPARAPRGFVLRSQGH